jgi:hypothetical protein
VSGLSWPVVAPSSIEVPAGPAILGRRRGNGFGWDNEFDEHTVETPAFAMSKYKVTNGEYLEFVRCGADPPYFWVRRGDEWFQRTMFGVVPLPAAWPVLRDATAGRAHTQSGWASSSPPKRIPSRRVRFPEWRRQLRFPVWDPVPVTDSLPKVLLNSRATAGSGLPPCFSRLPGSSRFPFYPGIPPIFSTAITTY